MKIDWETTAKILEAVAWPLVAVLAFWIFRQPLRAFLDRVATQATKLSLGNYSIELPELREATTQWQSTELDFRRMTKSDVFDSASHSLFLQLTQQDQADYAVIDLGAGDQWLSSRLFIFAVVLGRVRGVRALTFVATRSGVARRYIGVAEPEAAHLSLVRRYPWLEAAFVAACGPYDPKQITDSFALLSSAPIEMWQVQGIVRGYIEQIQQENVPAHTEQWESIADPAPQIWERTEWLSADDVEDVLGSSLQRGYVTSSVNRSKHEVVAAALRSPGKFVALLDEDRRLLDLIDRSELISKFVREAV